MKKDKVLHRGEIYFANLDPVAGSEQGGRRPVLVLQNDVGNQFAPTTIIAPITCQSKKHRYPTHVYLKDVKGLDSHSIVMLEQMRTISKERLESRIGKLNARTLREVTIAIHISLGLTATDDSR